MCVSYCATLRLTEDISKLHTVPIKQWIKDGAVFKFLGDNLDLLQYVRDLRSDHQDEMLHMFSLIVGKSRTPAPELPFTGQMSNLRDTTTGSFLPSGADVAVKQNVVTLSLFQCLTRYVHSKKVINWRV